MRKFILSLCWFLCLIIIILGFVLQSLVSKVRETENDYKEQILVRQTQEEMLRRANVEWEIKSRQDKECIKSLELKIQKQYELLQQTPWISMDGIATAYSPLDNVNGIEADADGNTTSIGLQPGPNIIAVDPERIPYGSEMVVIYPNGSILKGIAGDTGGALRSDSRLHIDIFKYTFVEACAHGIVPVQILWKVK